MCARPVPRSPPKTATDSLQALGAVTKPAIRTCACPKMGALLCGTVSERAWRVMFARISLKTTRTVHLARLSSCASGAGSGFQDNPDPKWTLAAWLGGHWVTTGATLRLVPWRLQDVLVLATNQLQWQARRPGGICHVGSPGGIVAEVCPARLRHGCQDVSGAKTDCGP